MKPARFEMFEGERTVEMFYLRLTKFQTIPEFRLELCNKKGDWLQTIAVFKEGELSLPRLSKGYREFFNTDGDGYLKVDYTTDYNGE